MRIRREYLMRCVQTWDVPEDGAPSPVDDDFGDFDEWVCNKGSLIDEQFEVIDDDQLDTYPVDPAGQVVTR